MNQSPVSEFYTKQYYSKLYMQRFLSHPTVSRVYPTVILIFALAVLVLAVLGFLWPVFSGAIILPQQLDLGFVSIHYYGLILATAVLTARFFALRRAQQYGLSKDRADNIIIIVILCGLFGARLYHVASEIQYYFANPQFIFAFWRGGLSIYGAVLGGAFSLAFLTWRAGWSWSRFNNFLNWTVFSVLAGQIIGRLGNLFNYEAYGLPTSLPWKMFVPVEFRMPQMLLDAFYHPWFLYESLANLLIFFVLLRWKRDSGCLFLWYLLLYNIARLGLEFLRIDSVFIGPLRLNALVSLVLVILASALLIKFRNGTNRKIS